MFYIFRNGPLFGLKLAKEIPWPYMYDVGYKMFFSFNLNEHQICKLSKYQNTKQMIQFSCSEQWTIYFFLFINFEMPKIVGILKFMTRKQLQTIYDLITINCWHFKIHDRDK